MTARHTPSRPPDTLYRAIVGTATALAAALVIVMLFPATRVLLPAVPSFVVMTHGFIILAASCIAFLALGRHRVLHDPASYWTGIGFAVLAILSALYVLAWPGVRASGLPLLGHLPGTSAWITELMQVVFGLLVIVAAIGHWPGWQALTGRRWGWSVAGWLSLAAVLGALVVVFEHCLPPMIGPGGVFTPLSAGVEYLDLLAMAAAAWLSARRYRRSGDTLSAYTALALIAWTFGWAASLVGGERYSAPWYLGRFFLIGGCLVVLFGLLWEYMALFRREQDKSAQLEAAATEAQRRAAELDAVIDSIADGVLIYDRDGRLLRTNGAMRALLQYTDEETALPLADRLELLRLADATGSPMQPEQAPASRALRGETLRGFELTMYPGTAREATSLYSGAPLRRPDGAITGAVLTVTDVTAMKRVEAALRNSEQRLSRAQEIAHLGSWELDLVNDKLTWSDEVYRIFGLTPQEFGATYEAFLERVHPDDRAAVDAAYVGSLRTNVDTYEIEHRVVRRDTGEIRTVHEKCEHFRDATGALLRSTGMVHDITDRKRAERALEKLTVEAQRHAAELEAIFAALSDPLVIFDTEGRVVRANPAAEASYGLSRGDDGRISAVQMQVRLPDGRVPAWEELPSPRALRGETVRDMHLVFTARDGQERHILNSAAPLMVQGRITGAVSIRHDITDLLAAQAELIAQRAFLQAVLDQMPSGLLVVEAGTSRVLLANRGIAAVWGRDMTGVVMSEFLEPVRASGLNGELRGARDWPVMRALQRGEEIHNEVVRVSRPDGTVMHISANAAPIRNEQGQIIAAIVAATDVTAAAQAQEELARYRDHLEDLVAHRSAELARSERQYRELVQTAPSAIIQYDPDGTMTLVNDYAERLFGYEPGELLGKQVMMLVPPVEEETGRNLEGLKDAVLADPVAFETSENENVTKDGRRLWMLWTNRALYHEQGNAAGIMTIGIDRTAHHEVEKQLRAHQEALRNAAAELAMAEQGERQRIATVLHDEVAQPLGAIKLYLSMLQSQHPQATDEVARLLELTHEAIAQSRGIMTDLSPPVLHRMGLAEALRWWGTVVEERHGLKVQVQTPSVRPQIDKTLEATVFQAAKELIQNVIKHAQASEIRLSLACDDGDLRLVVADNGRGFDPSRAVEATAEGGFGLLNLQERINYFGGSVTVSSEPGRGSEITLRLPGVCTGESADA